MMNTTYKLRGITRHKHITVRKVARCRIYRAGLMVGNYRDDEHEGAGFSFSDYKRKKVLVNSLDYRGYQREACLGSPEQARLWTYCALLPTQDDPYCNVRRQVTPVFLIEALAWTEEMRKLCRKRTVLKISDYLEDDRAWLVIDYKYSVSLAAAIRKKYADEDIVFLNETIDADRFQLGLPMLGNPVRPFNFVL